MADLVFFTGPMDCGKTTLALQTDYTQRMGGRAGLVFSCRDRGGQGQVSSRLGLAKQGIEVGVELDFWTFLVSQLTSGGRIDYLVCDEAQFYSAEQIDQLARVADELSIDVFVFGLLTDFRGELFPASRRLVELSDRLETLQVQPLCWCGQRATHNARTVDGKMVTEGEQVMVGDTGESGTEIAYEVLCRRHHRRRLTRAVARSTLSPEPLPFGRIADEED